MEFDWIEIVGACTGVTYLILEVKQNMGMWYIGLLNAIFYAIIFYLGGLYAIMSLQFYYMAMMIYGWWNWKHMAQSENTAKGNETSPVLHAKGILWLYITIALFAIWGAIYYVLAHFTDSQVPLWDGMTTALSIIGTWMLAKKYIEQWYIWIFVNIFSVWLYYTQGLQITALLYAFYAIMAVVGLFQWKKSL